MTTLSSRIYSRLLALYPYELRRDFGVEMELVFAEDVAFAHRAAGARGVFRVWRCALGEFIRLALPARLSSPALRAPAIAIVFSVLSLGTEWVLRHGTAAVLPTFATVLLPVVVIWICRGSSVISLRLSKRPREVE